MPAAVPTTGKALDLDIAMGFDVFTHPGLWFLFGCLFIILAIFIIEHLGRKKERKD
ncbi:MAG: hypothetical protein C5S38_03765 [Candidatus Methanophagaceae archaeon]|jgi:hypothetical protein|nr:MAG: hypothetical protein C5S38_03765 [Methanophagales archaeon]